MSFYPPEQRCPRCRVPLTQNTPTCPNCGLALTGMGSAPGASMSGPLSWQPSGPEEHGAPPTTGRFGNRSNSGPAMYRPGGQFAPRASGPWGTDAGESIGRPASDGQQRSGGFSGAGDRLADPGNASTGYQGAPGQARPSTGWGGSGGGLRSFADYRNAASGRGGPSGYQRSPADSRDTPASYENWPPETLETPGGFYPGEASPSYGGRQTLSGAPGPSWQSGGPSWQQPYAGAPTAYPGSQQAYYNDLAPYDQGLAPPPRRGKKVALIVIAILVLLGAGGAGAAYFLLRPKPIVTVTSKYMVGATPAGAATTILHLTGSKFAANSTVSFLLDGQPEPGHQFLQSDANGALAGDLTITTDWALGPHTLTAKDASGNVTAQGQAIIIVAQGEANTPGPKGAPADDTPSFTIKLTEHAHYKDTGENNTYAYTLVVTGQPDPAGGKVCNPGYDTGKLHTNRGTSGGLRFTETFVVTCSGTYKGGKLMYTQTYSNYKLAFSNGVTCRATASYVNQELDGSFTDATSISGTLSSGTPTLACSNGRSVTAGGVDGTWVGSLSS